MNRAANIKKIMKGVDHMYITDRLRILRLCNQFSKCHETADGTRINLDKLTDGQIQQIVTLIDAIPKIIERYRI